MGLLRRVESRIQHGVEGAFGRKSGRGVQPPELARMLVKEMDDHRTYSLDRIHAPNHFTVYLCASDRATFRPREASLATEFADHLERHAQEKGYNLPGRPAVAFTSDKDLRSGQYGILAEMIERPVERAPAANVHEVPAPSPVPATSPGPARSTRARPSSGDRPAVVATQNIPPRWLPN